MLDSRSKRQEMKRKLKARYCEICGQKITNGKFKQKRCARCR